VALQSVRRGMITLAVAAGLTIGAAGPASAETLTVRDARGDVMSFKMSDMGDDPEAEPQMTLRPNVANGDVLRTVFRHTSDRVAVRVTFAELKRAGEFRGDFVRVVTNEGVRRNVSIYAGRGMWKGEAEMTRPNDTTVRCAVRHKIDYDTNVVTVSFPRTCVSNPRWVRLGLGSMWVRSDMEEFFMDDAQLKAEVKDDLKLSPRIRRG
jgi:hypothetical protein